jgi:hypothetical protein
MKAKKIDSPTIELQEDSIVIKGLPRHLFDRMLTSSSLQARKTLDKLLDDVRVACQLGMQTDEDKQRVDFAIDEAARQELFLLTIGEMKDSWKEVQGY